MSVRSPLLAAVLAVLVAGTAVACASGEDVSTAGRVVYEVSDRVLDLRDESRATDATPESPGHDVTPGRDLPTRLFWPTEGDGPFPVVVFSHGFSSSPGAYYDLLESWAAAGVVVAAPTFPLTSERSALVEEGVLDQPSDVSFVLTQVLALDEGDSELAGRIDGAHVAVAGHSLGAMTSLGLLDACCRDSRVTAALVLSGTLRAFGATAIPPGLPTLFVHGTADEVLPVADGEAAFAAALGPKALVELPGGTHSAPYDDPADRYSAAVGKLTTDFLRWTLLGDATALAALRTDAAQPGLTELTDDQLTS
jgi:predicted dienelactone hydrolase